MSGLLALIFEHSSRSRCALIFPRHFVCVFGMSLQVVGEFRIDFRANSPNFVDEGIGTFNTLRFHIISPKGNQASQWLEEHGRTSYIF